jgi:hypothetical protein
VWPHGGKRCGAFYCGNGRKAQIIYRSPQPESIFVCGIAADGNQDLVFTRHIHVAGRII